MTEERALFLCKTLMQINREVASGSESDPAKLGKLAVDRFYEEVPDLTTVELDAITSAFAYGMPQ
jgi:hypothetical protein